jgi:hypothetical protein
MSFKSRIRVTLMILGFVVGLFLLDYLPTKAAEAADTSAQQEIFFSTSVPEQNHLRPISILPVTVEGEIVGCVAIYDDPTTQRSEDYLELYKNAGELVAISYFDSYGIERTAVDRGLLEDREELEGVFVVLLDGEAL